METVKSDVLVIGCGLAGCATALGLAKSGLGVSVITPSDDPMESSTKYAQGGIVYRCDKDPELLQEDMMKAGLNMSNPEMVRLLAEGGPKEVKDFLMDFAGVGFDKRDGKLDLTKEAAHSCRRIIHVNDRTGKAITEALMGKLKEFPNIRVFAGHSLVDILTESHHTTIKDAKDSCIGAYILDKRNGIVKTFISKKTVIATGGVGQVFLRTVNPSISRGDGLFAAFRAGAKLKNIEYIQFHPTSLFHRLVPDFLISEAIRGEGGILRNQKGEGFMIRYDERGSLAPRDVVTRGIFHEMLRTGDQYVLLDVSKIPPEKLKEHFSTIYKKCLDNGLDITKKSIPVSPTAHYICGGVDVDDKGRTSIGNLYAAGEVSHTGVHGANRLASTSLLECLLWGTRCAKDIVSVISESDFIDPEKVLPWRYTHKIEKVDPALIQQDWMTIKSIMWNYVGIVRTPKRLERAVADLEYLQKRINEFYKDAKICDELVGLRNGVGVALLIAKAALANKESKGCHYIENDEHKL
ncbi:MAG: L-aspartate oxidase [Candidatus Aenigmarchaeota archaeon]|nr:L-aspartate oxidase [Candidatus Aenigmarchaeota archaeon]